MSDKIKTTSTHHMCVDIEGVLRWSDKELSKLFCDGDGYPVRAATIRDWLKLQLLDGKRVLPMGQKCEGWSDITGCPGHEAIEAGELESKADLPREHCHVVDETESR